MSKQKSTVSKTKRQTKQQKLQQQSIANAAQRKTRGEVTSRDQDTGTQDNEATQREQGAVARGLTGHAREESRVREGTLVIDGVNRNSRINNTNNQVRHDGDVTDNGAHVRLELLSLDFIIYNFRTLSIKIRSFPYIKTIKFYFSEDNCIKLG